MVVMAAPSKIDPQEALRLHEEGLNYSEIGAKLGVTKQAARKAVLKAKGSDAAALPPWPWGKVAARHSGQRTSMYKAMLACRKRQAGLPLQEDEKRQADALEAAARQWGKVISYNQEIGFYWTNPREDEKERGELFVKR